MSPAKVNILGPIQKSLLETSWRMEESRPTIFAGDRAWIPGCRHGLCSGKDNHTRVRRGGGGGQQCTRMRTAYLLRFFDRPNRHFQFQRDKMFAPTSSVA